MYCQIHTHLCSIRHGVQTSIICSSSGRAQEKGKRGSKQDETQFITEKKARCISEFQHPKIEYENIIHPIALNTISYFPLETYL
jgi:hypothetical protein